MSGTVSQISLPYRPRKRTIQYSATLRFQTNVFNYWMSAVAGMTTSPRFNNTSNSSDRLHKENQMSVVIRLARAGTKKRPVYHVVVADSRYPRDGRFIERLGHFNPLMPKDNADRLKLDLDKVKAWLAKGAQPSDRVARFLDAAGVKKRAARNNPEKAVPRKERKAQAEAAAKS